MTPLPVILFLLLSTNIHKSHCTDHVDTLNTHNKYRAKHGVPSLEWAPEIAAFAQAHCTNLAVNSLFQHSKGSKYGENLYFSMGYAETGAGSRAVDAWYGEIKKYDFEEPGYQAGTGHFTQVRFGMPN